ncbi:hypothetical protein C8R43DRAFT_949355 [Mycena crocata]|nr:hypothetical protein C8R43DRAFT_949355 [Mycena crocata]
MSVPLMFELPVLVSDNGSPYATPSSYQQLRDAVSRLRPLLPVELWIEILIIVCECDSDTAFDHNAVRDMLLKCFPEWEAIIKGCPHFWRFLTIDCLSTVESVSRAIEFVQTTHIDVIIRLEPDDEFDDDSEKPDHSLPLPIIKADYPYRMDVSRRSMEAALPSSHLWKTICLWTAREEWITPMLDVLEYVSAPNLTSILFACPPRYPPRQTTQFSPPPPLFNGVLPNLVELELIDTALPWGDGAYFSRVETVKFSALVPMAWPSAEELARTFDVAVRLRHLVLGGGGVTTLPSTGFTLPVLESLTLYHWREVALVIGVLARGSYPVLTELNVHDFDRPSWTHLFMVPIFAQLLTVSVAGREIHTSHVLRLLERLTSVTRLDLASASSTYFSTLFSNPRLCPSLSSLSVDEVPSLSDLHTYIHCRRQLPVSELQTIDYYHNIIFPMDLSTIHLVSNVSKLVKLTSYPNLS